MPSVEARLLGLMALVAYAAAALLSLIGRRPGREVVGRWGAIPLAVGISLSLATLVLRLARGHPPTSSGIDAFTLLALLTGAVAAYLRAVDALPRVGLVLLPLAAAWSVLAVALSGLAYRDFTRDLWNVIHVVLSIAAAISFASAAVGGWLYLRKHRQLRGKDPAVFKWPLPPLERLDRFLRHALPVAFALVTATILAGLAGALQPGREGYFRNWPNHPKMLMATVAWLLYTLALHAAYAKRFRGRFAAILSIVGFGLLVVVLVASMLIPKA
jgi:ABC-type uncharacterized transport system permease subunit